MASATGLVDIESPEFLGKQLKPLDRLRGGDSLSPDIRGGMTGTLGYFVERNDKIGVLSNAHIMGMESYGIKVISPGRADGGTLDEDYIGTVEKVVVSEDVDCGYALLRDNITEFKLKDGTSVTGTEKAEVDTPVKFYGSTSGPKEGFVLEVDWAGTIGGRKFTDQIRFSPNPRPGDSGSLVVNSVNNKAVGLIFARGAGVGVANHIDEVLSALDVKIAI